MIDMGAVRAEVEAARAELLDEEDNPKAILSLGTRKRVWRAMIDTEDPGASYRRRIELKMACVRRVQHYWEQHYPGDQRVQEMLDLAQRLVDGRETNTRKALKQAKKFRKDVWTDDSEWTKEGNRAMHAAYGAAFMVVSACSRDPYDDITGPETNDTQLLPDSVETSYDCACAATGAMNGVKIHKTDVPARRAFWLWYLDEAIPAVLAD